MFLFDIGINDAVNICVKFLFKWSFLTHLDTYLGADFLSQMVPTFIISILSSIMDVPLYQQQMSFVAIVFFILKVNSLVILKILILLKCILLIYFSDLWLMFQM